MAQTITQKTPLNACRLATGAYLDTGTVAAYNFNGLGFKPRYVKVQNVAATGAMIEWYEGMPDAYAVKKVTAGDMTYITSLGITVNSRGFTFGLDTDANVTSEQVYFLALG